MAGQPFCKACPSRRLRDGLSPGLLRVPVVLSAFFVIGVVIMAAVVSEKQVLVLGGGITGVSAASQLASAGLQVHLIEHADHLGGRALEFGCKATDACQKCNVCLALDRFRKISQVSNVHTHLSSRLTAVAPGSKWRPLPGQHFHPAAAD